MKRLRGPGASYSLIWQTVLKIPTGKVATYGQIAKLSGLNGQARLVGYALHNLPHGIEVPWQRVINAQGKISFPIGSHSYQKQRLLLENEGIRFVKDKVDLGKYGWKRKLRQRH